MWEEYVIDASMSYGDLWCYCPIDGEKIVLGMNCIGFCPGKLVGVYHPDGEKFAQDFVNSNPDWKSRHQISSTSRKVKTKKG